MTVAQEAAPRRTVRIPVERPKAPHSSMGIRYHCTLDLFCTPPYTVPSQHVCGYQAVWTGIWYDLVYRAQYTVLSTLQSCSSGYTRYTYILYLSVCRTTSWQIRGAPSRSTHASMTRVDRGIQANPSRRTLHFNSQQRRRQS